MSMDIKSAVGAELIVTRETYFYGSVDDKAQAFAHLKIGKKYHLAKIEVHDFITYVWIKEIPGVRFNSVQFENFHVKHLQTKTQKERVG